jgi:hydroxymethylpyrimidine/phosphomethylpyrimidine kinase
MIPHLLTIAGSDPSGGAGVQADLKTFSALGAYGMAAITALTAQNTRGVTSVHPVPPAFVARQIDVLFEDAAVDAVKIGMLGDAEVAKAVAEAIERAGARNIVVDPVMIATDGHRLLDVHAVAIVREALVPLATVITPNLVECGALLGTAPPSTLSEMREAARALHALGPRIVYLKGGHLAADSSPDVFFDGKRLAELDAPRLSTNNTHGTGCTLSSAIAALLPRVVDPLDAARLAKAYLHEAITASGELAIGGGRGPVHHFHALWAHPNLAMLDAIGTEAS